METNILRIKEVLKEKKVKSIKLANQLGVGKQYISNIINARKDLSLKSLQKIATALNVPISSLFADYQIDRECKIYNNTTVCPYCNKPIRIHIEKCN